MRICVVGCGAIGSIFAANLARLDGVEVWAYHRSEKHVRAINERGLRLTGAEEVFAHPRATSDPAELPPCDFGLVAVKSMDTEAAIRATGHAFRDGCVCSLQNGLGNEEVIARHAERVIRGTAFPGGSLVEPGVVRWTIKGDTTLGPFEPRPAPVEEVERLADACTRAGLPTAALADSRGPQWRKVIFNATTNTLGALTGLPHGRMYEFEPLNALMRALVEEGKAVAAAEGIELDADPNGLLDHAARKDVGYHHKSSMLQDVEARRSTEVEWLNGGIVRFAHGRGVATPLHEAVLALVHGIERSWVADAGRKGDDGV